MKNVLITGISSGIGRELTKKLIKDGYKVWGIARNQSLLKELEEELDSPKFQYSVFDLSTSDPWLSLIKSLKKKKFIPDTIVFNAAINKNDLVKDIDFDCLEEIFKVNFFSIIKGVKLIKQEYINPLHFIAISSTSSLKGNYREGIGYAASKAALSIAFESLYQKYNSSKIKFTTIYFGPIKTGMMPFRKLTPFVLTSGQAAEVIIKAIREKSPFYYYPKIIFIFLSLVRLLPKPIYFKLWNRLQKPYFT